MRVGIDDVGSAGMRFVECGNNALTRLERFISSKASSDRTIKIGALRRILQPGSDAQPFEPAQVQHDIQAIGTRGMEINRQKQPRNTDLVVFKAVMTGMSPRRKIEAHVCIQLLRPSNLPRVL